MCMEVSGFWAEVDATLRFDSKKRNLLQFSKGRGGPICVLSSKKVVANVLSFIELSSLNIRRKYTTQTMVLLLIWSYSIL